MTRTSHHPHPTPSFPVYCLDWADDDTLLLGGGGGASRSGIDNKLVRVLILEIWIIYPYDCQKLAKVSRDARKVRYVNELRLSNQEDAPMTMAVDRPVSIL